jgi:hypothetical protein
MDARLDVGHPGAPALRKSSAEDCPLAGSNGNVAAASLPSSPRLPRESFASLETTSSFRAHPVLSRASAPGINGDRGDRLQRRTTGDEPQKVDWSTVAKSGAVVQKELNETIVKSREEIEELLETEDRQQLGDITDEVSIRHFVVLLSVGPTSAAPCSGNSTRAHLLRASNC